ncbi:hypothetical protein CMV_001176 [Castanea mollissima]|uniref:Uncharacterized protein n=1 Tax=Castanea mollissima TaxID=60419 RepID=A0A8J4S2X2_9ROSI|nr:hypothetical protein CMV_001176 [Castanea mollissima]
MSRGRPSLRVINDKRSNILISTHENQVTNCETKHNSHKHTTVKRHDGKHNQESDPRVESKQDNSGEPRDRPLGSDSLSIALLGPNPSDSKPILSPTPTSSNSSIQSHIGSHGSRPKYHHEHQHKHKHRLSVSLPSPDEIPPLNSFYKPKRHFLSSRIFSLLQLPVPKFELNTRYHGLCTACYWPCWQWQVNLLF